MSEAAEEKSCEVCKKMDELIEEGKDICPKVWSCKVYARPGKEYKHFEPREIVGTTISS